MLSEFFTYLTGDIARSALLGLTGIVVVAGFSRGLTGFGAGMIFTPLASAIISPVAAIGLMWTIDTPGSLPIAWRAAQRAQWREAFWMFGGWLISTPVGLWLLKSLDALTIRWAICGMIFGALPLLLSGWSYSGKPTATLAAATGLVAGFLGGVTGLSGPPIVLLWLTAAAASKGNVRDNLNFFYLLTSIANAAFLAAFGILTWAVIKLGLVLAVPYSAGLYLGSRIFRHVSDRDYRRLAYGIIGVAATLALPLLDGWLGR